MKRLLGAFGLGTTIAIGLFYLMSTLIAMDGRYKKPSNSNTSINFLRVKNTDQTESRHRHLPKKPPLPKDPPKVSHMSVAKAPTPSNPHMNLDVPKLTSAVDLGNGPYLAAAAAGGAGDGQVMPLVRIEPQYPRQAAMRGIEGWVLLQFDITSSGTVDNIEVLDSEPRRIFDSEARRALLKWKYKPRVEEGKAVAQPANKVKLAFKLEG